MRKPLIILAVVGIILLVTLPFTLPLLGGIPIISIHSYDGPVATIESVEHGYPDTLSGPIEDVQLNAAYVIPGTPDLYDVMNPCGLKFTIQSAPVLYETVLLDSIEKLEVDDTAKTNTSILWEVHELEFRMGVTIETFAGGLLSSYGATFWIELLSNDDSIFSTADESYACFVQVYTNQPSEIVGGIEIYGEDQGFTFDRTSLTTQSIPQEILDSGYTISTSSTGHIKFPIQVIAATPSLFLATRSEAEAEMHISIMVILFGVWERLVPYVEWDNPVPPGLFDWIFALIPGIVMFVWFGIGIVATLLILLKVKNPKIVGIGLLVVWVIVLWQSGAFNQIIEILGGSAT